MTIIVDLHIVFRREKQETERFVEQKNNSL